MNYSLLLPTAALASALALGCADQQSPTGPTAALPSLSLRAEHVVLPNAVYLGGFPDNPLVIGAGFGTGVTPADVCSNPDPSLAEGEGKVTLTPTGGFLGHFSGRDVTIDVFEFGGGTDPCAIAGAPLIATGTGKFTYNLIATGPAAVVIHATVQGIVDLVSGGQARVLGTARVVIQPDGTLLFDEERVRLTPI
jgi:hypothetical protein